MLTVCDKSVVQIAFPRVLAVKSGLRITIIFFLLAFVRLLFYEHLWLWEALNQGFAVLFSPLFKSRQRSRCWPCLFFKSGCHHLRECNPMGRPAAFFLWTFTLDTVSCGQEATFCRLWTAAELWWIWKTWFWKEYQKQPLWQCVGTVHCGGIRDKRGDICTATRR